MKTYLHTDKQYARTKKFKTNIHSPSFESKMICSSKCVRIQFVRHI